MVGDKVRAVAKIIVRIFRFSSKCDRKPPEKFKQGNNFKRITLNAVWRKKKQQQKAKNCRSTQWKKIDQARDAKKKTLLKIVSFCFRVIFHTEINIRVREFQILP